MTIAEFLDFRDPITASWSVKPGKVVGLFTNTPPAVSQPDVVFGRKLEGWKFVLGKVRGVVLHVFTSAICEQG